jgi:3-methyl-2-oxobutanoate hydroxymethyltransferase
VQAAVRIVKEAGADMVKLDGAAEFPETVAAITRAGVPVFAQFGMTPQTSVKYDVNNPAGMTNKLVEDAKRLEAAGAALLDFTHSGPIAGPAVVSEVSIPVIGGMGGGPWLDGRMRLAHAAIGYAASTLDSKPDAYANVAQITLDALTAYADDVRAARQIRGGIPVQKIR